MRGRSAPMRCAAAGVKTVVSAPVSRRRVTAAPLANKVTIGALRSVATVVSPSRTAPQPPGPSAADGKGFANGVGSPRDPAETSVAATSAPLNHLFTGNPLTDWALNRAHRGDICDRSVQGERDELFAEPGHARLCADPRGPAQLALGRVLRAASRRNHRDRATSARPRPLAAARQYPRLGFASGTDRRADDPARLARARSGPGSEAWARRIRARRLTTRGVWRLLWLGERRTVPRRAAAVASLSEHGRRVCPFGGQLQFGGCDGDPAACHWPTGGSRRQQRQLGRALGAQRSRARFRWHGAQEQ